MHETPAIRGTYGESPFTIADTAEVLPHSVDTVSAEKAEQESLPTAHSPDAVRHFPELDGIRGIAITMVLLAHSVDILGVVPKSAADPGYHAWGRLVLRIFLQGWGGVDIFFALSGFLITGILLRARNRPNYFSAFYARRALRIFPVYYAFLTLGLIFAYFSKAYRTLLPDSPGVMLSYFFYVQNWPVFWKSWAGMTGAWGAYWSLAVEEQFYMVWPTLIRFVKFPVLLAICIAGALLGPFTRLWILHFHGLNLGLLQSPFSREDGLFIGAAIAIYREVHGKPVPMRWAKLAAAAGIIILAYIALFHSPEFEGKGTRIWLIGPSAFALIAGAMIAASHFRPPVLHTVLTWRPLLVAGKLSYGMYVYHITIYWALATYVFALVTPHLNAWTRILLPLVAIPLTILLVTLVAELSFRYFETPFLRLKRHFPSPAAPV